MLALKLQREVEHRLAAVFGTRRRSWTRWVGKVHRPRVHGRRRQPGIAREQALGPVFPEGIAASPQAKKPATAGAERASWGLPTLPVDPVRALPAFRLEGLDGVTGFLHGAGHEPADSVLLPAHLLHDLDQRRPALALQNRHYLGGLTALARCGRILRFRGLFAWGRVLGRRGLLASLRRRGRTLGAPCPSLGFGFRFRLRTLAQALDARPHLAGRGLMVGEALHRPYASQAVPDRYQPLLGPGSGEFPPFLLAGETVERSGCGGRSPREGGLKLGFQAVKTNWEETPRRCPPREGD